MHTYYLAVDIGASGGRHMLAHMEQGKMVLEEIHRFPNGMLEENGELYWDVDQLFAEIKIGMKKCAAAGKIPASMGIDTWAVDFVLLDRNGQRLGNAVAYRDKRTDGIEKQVYSIVPEEELYGRTGIQRQKFNTIYQLMALKQQQGDQLKKAKKLLMIPDYFHYLLSGKAVTEYTNATTTQLVSPVTKQWDMELIEKLGFPKEIFMEIRRPGSELSDLRKEIQEEVGFNCKIILPATHDTGSAVMAVPAMAVPAMAVSAMAVSANAVPSMADEGKKNPGILYISSGTWSLLGTELFKADCSERSRQHNFTNEGGYDYRFRYLKNIMGLWMIQSVRQEIGGGLSYGEICEMAAGEGIRSIVDCNAERFLKPENMAREIQMACEETGQEKPEGIAQAAAVIYHSLAKCYAAAVGELEAMTGRKFQEIHIVGGGSNADYLNQLTANATKKTVLAGPAEATAIGNCAAQMLGNHEWRNLDEARECIYRSFPVQIYQPSV